MNENIKQQIEQIEAIDQKFKKKVSLNEREVAQIIGISPSSMATRRKEGTGPEYKKFGGRYLYPKKALAEWLLQTIKTA